MTELELNEKITVIRKDISELQVRIIGFDSSVQFIRDFVTGTFLDEVENTKRYKRETQNLSNECKKYTEIYQDCEKFLNSYKAIKEFTEARYQSIESLLSAYMKDEKSAEKTKKEKINNVKKAVLGLKD